MLWQEHSCASKSTGSQAKAILSPVGLIKAKDKATVYCTIEGAVWDTEGGMQQTLAHGS